MAESIALATSKFETGNTVEIKQLDNYYLGSIYFTINHHYA